MTPRPEAARPREPVGSLEIHVRAWPALARTHLTVRGPLASATVPELLTAVRGALQPGDMLTLDLSDVTTIDAAGVQALRDCDLISTRREAELVIQDPSPRVRRALREAGSPSRPDA